MAFKSYKAESRANWGRDQEAELTIDQIQLGCILRMADSMEKIASTLEDTNRYLVYLKRALETEQRRSANYRGQIKKLKQAVNKGVDK